MTRRPEFLSFDVEGGQLGALRWTGIVGAPTVVAIHGITANAWSWDPLAHHMSGGANLLAIDLRGRGRSFEMPGPFGIRQHADDVAAVIKQIGGPVVLVGHSMGAYVALMVTARHPTTVKDVVLVDGGTPLPVPEGADIDEALDTTLGPALARLGKVWSDRTSYYGMWSNHPAFAEGISIDLERNLLEDLIEADDGFRTAVNVDAVRHDGRELLADEDVRTLLHRRTARTAIVRAPNGLLGAPPPLISDEVIRQFPNHRWIHAADTNHYTVVMGPAGATIVAKAIRDALAT